MKIKRQKKAQKILTFYRNTFDLRPPYTVLVDGTFCRAALSGKVAIKEQIPKYLGDQTKLVTTQCIIVEVEQLSKISPKLYGTWLVVKQFPVRKCGHEGASIPASACIKSLLKKSNPGKYIVAAQDKGLRRHVHRSVTGTPVLYLYQSAPTLEKPTDKSQTLADHKNKTMNSHEMNTLKALKRQYLGQEQETKREEEGQLGKKKRQRLMQRQALSHRKSKKKIAVHQPQNSSVGGKKCRRRNRKKSHVSHGTS